MPDNHGDHAHEPDPDHCTLCCEKWHKEELAKSEAEVVAVLEAMPPGSVVRVREGGGPENVYASLAVSVLKISGQVEQRAAKIDELRDKLQQAAEIVAAPHALLERGGQLTVVGVSVILADKTRAIMALIKEATDA